MCFYGRPPVAEPLLKGCNGMLAVLSALLRGRCVVGALHAARTRRARGGRPGRGRRRASARSAVITRAILVRPPPTRVRGRRTGACALRESESVRDEEEGRHHGAGCRTSCHQGPKHAKGSPSTSVPELCGARLHPAAEYEMEATFVLCPFIAACGIRTHVQPVQWQIDQSAVLMSDGASVSPSHF